jgi:hypothetical protein
MVGVVGLAVFAVCFTPDPVLLTWPEFVKTVGSLVGR